MTEKRFISNYDGSEIIDRKGSIAYAFHSGAEEPVIELLNRLNDENEQLKREINELYEQIENLKIDLEIQRDVEKQYIEDCWKLKDEIKELEEKINEFKPILFESDGNPTILYIKGELDLQ